MSDQLSPGMAREVESLRRNGYEVLGPSPAGMSHGMPAEGLDEPSAGMRCQINVGHHSIWGEGGTADEAMADAIAKLSSIDAEPAPPSG